MNLDKKRKQKHDNPVGMRCMLLGIQKEINRLLEELFYLNTFLRASDRLALTAALTMITGVLLPRSWEGGSTYLMLAWLTLLQIMNIAGCHITAIKQEELSYLRFRLLRTS